MTKTIFAVGEISLNDHLLSVLEFRVTISNFNHVVVIPPIGSI